MTEREQRREQIRSVLDDLRASLAFLTIIPGSALGEAAGARPDFKRGAQVFPIVGALIGLAGGAVLVLAVAVDVPPVVSAALAVTAIVLLTGALHEDGLADTADGFGGGATSERKLEIMDDSAVGAYGATALILALLLRVVTLAALVPSGGVRAAAVLVAAEAASRAAMVRLWHELPAARLGGMAEGTGPPDSQAMLTALIVAAVIVVLAVLPTFGFWATLAGAALLVAVAFAFARLTALQIGGRTGDTLGACQQVTAVAFLVGVTPFA
jgi:adenosylcobinamide-GDP ribazoletransferase